MAEAKVSTRGADKLHAEIVEQFVHRLDDTSFCKTATVPEVAALITERAQCPEEVAQELADAILGHLRGGLRNDVLREAVRRRLRDAYGILGEATAAGVAQELPEMYRQELSLRH